MVIGWKRFELQLNCKTIGHVIFYQESGIIILTVPCSL